MMLMIGSLLLASCGAADSGASTSIDTSTSAPASDPNVEELESARQRWTAAALGSYSFVYQDDCGECDPIYRLPRKGVVWESEPAVASQPTIEGLFSQIETAIQDGRSVDVTYHPELGHPEEISIDMHTRPVDGGTHLLVDELTAGLPGEVISLDALTGARARWDENRPSSYEFVTAIGCDCRLAGEIWARVENRRLLDWRVTFDDGEGDDISAITVDDMFDDLTRMLSSADGVVEEGVRFSGSAEYHPDLGYPIWVGLDIEILDPESELAYLPPRLVFAVQHLEPTEGAQSTDTALDDARQKWRAAELGDYEYELTIHDISQASFSDPYLVTVSGGAVTRVEQDGQTIEEVEAPTLAVEELFDLIQTESDKGLTVDVLYHQVLGYPVFLAMREAGPVETSLAISISGLEPSGSD